MTTTLTITLQTDEFLKLKDHIRLGKIKEMQSIYLTDPDHCVESITLSDTTYSINDLPVTKLDFDVSTVNTPSESIVIYTDGTLYYTTNGTLTAIAINNILFTEGLI